MAQGLLLSVEEAAEALNLGRAKVWQLVGDGTLPSIKIGRTRRVSRQALLDFVERLSAGESSPVSGDAPRP
jgi:excisionase family DNA binding protein